MSCRRKASALLTLVLVVSLLALDHPVAHARHVKESSISTGDSSSMKKGLQGVNRKLDVGKKTKRTEDLEVKIPRGEGAQHSLESNFGHGGSLIGVEVDKVVVVAHRGPTQHPKKHN